jgi:hypothetical protein
METQRVNRIFLEGVYIYFHNISVHRLQREASTRRVDPMALEILFLQNTCRQSLFPMNLLPSGERYHGVAGRDVRFPPRSWCASQLVLQMRRL